MSNRAAIYVRVSTDKQTIENQLRELRQIAERRGWEVTMMPELAAPKAGRHGPA
jgi:DNA invertase Pin-like site-specific DNA recombinase